MKLLLLFGVAAIALGGCDLLNGGCPRFDSVPFRQQGVEATIVAALPDTVVVALVETPLFPLVETPYDLRRVLGGDSLRVRGFLTTHEATPDLTARLSVRGDTVFVSLDAPLTRLACSPPPYPGEGDLVIELPRGVVVRRVVGVPQGPAPVSVSPPPVFRPTLRA